MGWDPFGGDGFSERKDSVCLNEMRRSDGCVTLYHVLTFLL